MDPLAAVPVSTLCDVDKSLPVVDPAIRPLTSARLCGPAYTVVADGEFLSVLWAIDQAEAGDVLVVQASGMPLAALGELLANEAARRGLGGIVVDGWVRDRTGLPTALPLWARGTVPMAGRSDVAPRVGGAIRFGGVVGWRWGAYKSRRTCRSSQRFKAITAAAHVQSSAAVRPPKACLPR